MSNSTGKPAADIEDIRAYYDRVLPFYEDELADRGDDDLWTRSAGEPAGCRVLELGAGTGRATAFLARRARSVVALDLSPRLLAVARRRLSGQPHVAFLAADMREMQLRQGFDLVVAVDDPFVHLTEGADRDRAFVRVATHLAPGGRFLLDAAWLSPGRRRAALRPPGLVIEHAPGVSRLEVRETWKCEAATRLCRTRFEYRRDGRLVGEASFASRLWSLDELQRRAGQAGLVLSRLWGDYDQRPWDRDTSPRLIAEMLPAPAPSPPPP